jgi:predicted RNase H-like HicB family nuclease
VGQASRLPYSPLLTNSRQIAPSLFRLLISGEETAMKYKIVMHRSDEGITVSVPTLPGCWSEGDTEEEAILNIQDAIHEYLAALEARFQNAEVREVEV